MASVEETDHYFEIQHFHQFVADRCLRGITGDATGTHDIDCRFLPFPDLKTYFDDDGENDRLRKIVNKILPSRGPPSVALSAIRSEYLKVFAILLRIDKGRFIKHFVVHPGLADNHLPFIQRPPDFPTSPDFFDAFFEEQWMFCAPVLQYARQRVFPPRTILPITSRVPIGAGGDADVYKVVVHPSYNMLHANSETTLDPSDQLYNTFVLKSYHNDAEEQCGTEVENFVHLRASLGRWFPGIIGFHGSFTHNGIPNVLLEYANEGTLEDYFKRVTSPSTGPEIYTFWSGLLSLIDVLAGLHCLPFENCIHVGFHQDITPKNILVCRREGKSIYECDFKLADLGLSHIHPVENAQGRDARGTRAPELYRCGRVSRLAPRKITPAADVWSLGCVFSEAGVWLVRGIEGTSGLRRYRERRTKETENAASSKDPGCFHDSEGVLKCVATTHEMLLHDLRKSDTLTEAVLDMIYCMLLPEARRVGSLTLSSIATHKLETKKPIRPQSHIYPVRDLRSSLLPAPTAFDESRVDTAHLEAELQELRMRKGKHREETDSAASSSVRPASSHPAIGNSPDGPGTLPSSRSLNGRSPVGQGLQPRYYPDRTIMTTQDHAPHSTLENFQHPANAVSPNVVTLPRRLQPNPTPLIIDPGNAITLTRGAETTPTDHAPKAVVNHFHRTSELASVHSRVALSTPDKLHPHPRSHSDPPRVDNSPKFALPVTDTPTVDLPVLSVLDAWTWRDSNRKKSFEDAIKLLPHGYWRGDLDDRDHVFMLDNSTSMAPHWPNVVNLLDIMTYIVKKSDPDGADVYLAIDPDRKHHKRSKHTRDLVEFAKEHCPSQDSKRISNISSRLDSILQEYRTLWENDTTRRHRTFSGFRSTSKKPMRKLSLYIFTDGPWYPQPGLDSPIRSIVRKLEELDKSKDQIGVQFIRFGDNEDGKEVLEHLDSGLGLRRDIVDTEPYEGGNVWKMLLGSINPWFDGDQAGSAGGPNSPGALLSGSEDGEEMTADSLHVRSYSQ